MRAATRLFLSPRGTGNSGGGLWPVHMMSQGETSSGERETLICGAVSQSGRYGEPLACAFPKGHAGAHAWASLPTFVNGEPQGWIDPLRPGRSLR